MGSWRRLNEVNQRIWDYGFTSDVLIDLDLLAKDIKNGAAVFERIPQAQQSGLSKGSELLCAASIICRGCPRTESETREIYNTGDLIKEGFIQEVLIETWANIKGCWYDSPESFIEQYFNLQDYGTESVVYFNVNDRLVCKMISLKNYNVVRTALDRIILHNAIFPETYMKVIGFGRNIHGEFVVIVLQNYVVGDTISEDDRMSFMYKMDFQDAGSDLGMHLNFKTDCLYVGDLNEYNAIKGATGIQVIDADCRLNVPTLGFGGKYIIPQPDLDFSNPCDAWKPYINK